jgi:hypothetical protein
MLLLAILACAGTTAAGTTQDDLDAALDRIEALEAQVVALQLASGAAEVDDDGDGLRDRDGLPLGTKRGDVLFDEACDAPGDVVAFPLWFAPTPQAVPSVGLWTSETTRGNMSWRWEGAEGAIDIAGQEIPCDGRPLEYLARWVAVSL